jgi:hypothetical protein
MSSSESLKTYSYPDGRVKAFDRFDDLEVNLNPMGYLNRLCAR